MTARVNREGAYKFALHQLECESDVYEDDYTKPNGQHHYGKMDIQELLDYIYGVNAKGEYVEQQEIITKAKKIERQKQESPDERT